MNPQRNRLRPDAWAITTSFVLYRFLLIICPPTFRRDYGDEMATLFRDCCRDAWTHGGVLALLGLWGRALIDLAVTAASERMKEGVEMSKPLFIRVAGLAGLIAGVWNTFLFASLLASNTTHYIVFAGTFAEAWMSSAIVAATLPATWILFLLGLLGLHAYLAQHVDGYSWLVWSAALLTGAGAIILLVGAPLTIQTFHRSWPFFDYLDYYVFGAHTAPVGFVSLGIGLLGAGWLALRTRALGRLGWVPFVAGSLALVSVIVVKVVPVQAVYYSSTLYIQFGYLGVQLAFFGVWVVGWIFLGFRLWSRPLISPLRMTLSPAN